MSIDTDNFSRLRNYLFPIHSSELYKFIPLFFLSFFVSLNYNILRNVKDTLLITAKSSGAEVIPFIKVWGIVPAAFVMTFIYSRLNNRLSRDRLFYSMIMLFLSFFAIFTFVLYPLQNHLHPHACADFVQSHLPLGCKGLISMFRYWTFSCFYIMSELWSTIVLSMMFWGIANEVSHLNEAKRFYGLILAGLNAAAICSGQLSVFLSSSFINTHISISENHWYQTIILLTLVIIASGITIMCIYKSLSKRCSNKDNAVEHKNNIPQKIKMSMRNNFAVIMKSRYLLCLTVIVLSYNMAINLIEVIWKDQIRMLYPNPSDFNIYMNHITSATGVISTLTSFLISGPLIRRFGWTCGALVTPIVILATSFAFFFFLFSNSFNFGFTILGLSPLVMTVFFGSMQNCLARASKFTVFDTTKEMAFIPLSTSDKRKGKAVIDGMGSRVGKSGGSLTHQGLLIVFSTISASAHIVAGILLVIFTVWIGSVLSLGKRFIFLTSNKPSSTENYPSDSEKVAELV